MAFDLGDVAAETVAAGRLSLVSGKYGPVVQEKTLHADTDERARYIDEGEQAAITVKVFERGQPVADDRAKLLVMQYDKNWSSGDPIAVDPGGQPIDKRVLEVKDGRAWLDVKVHKPGVCYLAYTAYPANQSPPAVQPDPQSQGYTAVRGLPFDNLLEQHTGDDELSWKFLYERVLRTWDKVYPVMSVVRDLHKKTVFDGMTEQTRFAISPERFETCWYMPITRDLSAGKRKLILRYLNLLPNRVPPDSVTPDTAVAELPGARTEG